MTFPPHRKADATLDRHSKSRRTAAVVAVVAAVAVLIVVMV